MEQNIIIHDLDWDWIAGWVNLQLIYNIQTCGDKNQKSLATAMNLYTCAEHGSYLVRLKFRKDDAGLWCANRLIYEADECLEDFYKAKTAQSRRRGRGHGSRRNRPAK